MSWLVINLEVVPGSRFCASYEVSWKTDFLHICFINRTVATAAELNSPVIHSITLVLKVSLHLMEGL